MSIELLSYNTLPLLENNPNSFCYKGLIIDGAYGYTRSHYFNR
jgi:hypothetical protein